MTAKASEGAVRAADATHKLAHTIACESDWFEGDAFGLRVEKIASKIDTLAVQPERDRALEEAAAAISSDSIASAVHDGDLSAYDLAAKIRSLKGGN